MATFVIMRQRKNSGVVWVWKNSNYPFARTISVPVLEGQPKKFPFQAVVVETSAANAQALRERFYALEKPTTFNRTYPYTGSYQFVPLIKSKEWPLTKILNLAQLHVKIIQDLRTIYLSNIQDLNSVANDDGDHLLSAFLNMVTSSPPTVYSPPQPLLHSIHNNTMLKPLTSFPPWNISFNVIFPPNTTVTSSFQGHPLRYLGHVLTQLAHAITPPMPQTYLLHKTPKVANLTYLTPYQNASVPLKSLTLLLLEMTVTLLLPYPHLLLLHP